MAIRVLLTTGDLGTDHNRLVSYAIYTPQGLAACRKLAEDMAAERKRPVHVYVWHAGRTGSRVLSVD